MSLDNHLDLYPLCAILYYAILREYLAVSDRFQTVAFALLKNFEKLQSFPNKKKKNKYNSMRIVKK